MRIEVDRLNEAGETFARTYAPEELQLEAETRLVSAANVSGRASKKREQVRLRGKLTASVEVACDRCVAPVIVPVDADFDVTYIPVEADITEPEATELQEDDLSFAVYEGGHVDLDELMREQVLLALPTRQLCREDCKGLCPNCGADLNAQSCRCEQPQIDPRWAALATLKKSDE